MGNLLGACDSTFTGQGIGGQRSRLIGHVDEGIPLEADLIIEYARMSAD